jgi:hypothetical protein
METKKVIIIQLLCLISAVVTAQTIMEHRMGFARSQGNIAGGYLFSQKKMMPYIQGDFDLFLHDKVSMTGEGWFSFPTKKQQLGLRDNHAIFSGFNVHFTKQGRWDPYMGFAPGMAIGRVGYMDGETYRLSKAAVAPVLSANLGCNFYIGSIFNFYLKLKGVAGQLFTKTPNATPLHELKITAGLGWNARIFHKDNDGRLRLF